MKLREEPPDHALVRTHRAGAGRPAAGSDLVGELQEFVKKQIAPYKYPRRVEFLDALPRTETGKIQRFKLRELEIERVAVEKAER